ncbi:Hypothetical protein GLP15_3604 [Giardia lamblia P15]|uniref:Uncharacterized protein n=1 Tax=Giardia intestinalis (strain P15) TaxID=658858 RepID=E1F4F1_GIAIA|nr:Hypothetical protein GLP15_3604 [Giardia lamblia P15]
MLAQTEADELLAAPKSNGSRESTTSSCAVSDALTWDGARSRPPSGTPRGERHTAHDPCPDAFRRRLSESRGLGQLLPSGDSLARVRAVWREDGRRPRLQLSQTRCTTSAPMLVCRLYDAWRPGELWPEQGASQSRTPSSAARGRQGVQPGGGLAQGYELLEGR